MTRPVLGISCCTRTLGSESAHAVIDRYVTAAMRHADAAALLVPALPELMRADEIVPRLDGLLLTGSPSNLDPARYGDPAPDAPGPFDPARDAMTTALVHAMLAAGRPVFGICRGLQEINVAFSGTLCRDIGSGTLRRDTGSSPDLIPHHAPDDAGFAEMFDHCHEVTLTPGGRLHAAFAADRLVVSSVHYQGIDRLGSGLAVEARAADGLVEAVAAPNLLAVQWHPEWDAATNPQSRTFFHLLGQALRAR